MAKEDLKTDSGDLTPFQQAKQDLGLPADASDEAVATAVKSQAQKMDTLEARFDVLESKLGALVEALQAQAKPAPTVKSDEGSGDSVAAKADSKVEKAATELELQLRTRESAMVADLQKENAQLKAAESKRIINEAIAKGKAAYKITPDMEAQWTKLAHSDFERFQEMLAAQPADPRLAAAGNQLGRMAAQYDPNSGLTYEQQHLAAMAGIEEQAYMKGLQRAQAERGQRQLSVNPNALF